MDLKELEGTEGLRRHTAKLGMVLFGLWNKLPVEDAERELNGGLDVCNIVSELHKLRSAADVTSVKEAALFDRFSAAPQRQGRPTHRLEQIGGTVEFLRGTIERLLRYEPIKDEDLELSTKACHELYMCL
jgi:hypothetical protein